MAIDRAKLEKHFENYAQVHGDKLDKFVCPITLRQCDESELIDGHILPDSLINASKKTVIQYKRVDNFFGSRVEESFIHYMNLPFQKAADLYRHSELSVRFSDGVPLRAFVAEGENAMKASGHFPIKPLIHQGEYLFSIFVCVPKDDPRLNEPGVELVGDRRFMPSHWVASLLKAGYLTLFELLGYRVAFDPLGHAVRHALAAYYNANAKSSESIAYFKDFKKSVWMIGKKEKDAPNSLQYAPFEFDSIVDRHFIAHFTPRETLFAVTCIFKINKGTMAVMLPQCNQPGNADMVATANNYYNRVVTGDEQLPHKMTRMMYKDETWHGVENLNMTMHDLR